MFIMILRSDFQRLFPQPVGEPWLRRRGLGQREKLLRHLRPRASSRHPAEPQQHHEDRVLHVQGHQEPANIVSWVRGEKRNKIFGRGASDLKKTHLSSYLLYAVATTCIYRRILCLMIRCEGLNLPCKRRNASWIEERLSRSIYCWVFLYFPSLFLNKSPGWALLWKNTRRIELQTLQTLLWKNKYFPGLAVDEFENITFKHFNSRQARLCKPRFIFPLLLLPRI